MDGFGRFDHKAAWTDPRFSMGHPFGGPLDQKRVRIIRFGRDMNTGSTLRRSPAFFLSARWHLCWLSWGLWGLAACDVTSAPPIEIHAATKRATERMEPLPLRVPDSTSIPADETGLRIRRGKVLAERTQEELPEHVGNGFHCTSCHLQSGTQANAAPWVGVRARYPQHRNRSGHQVNLEDRVNDCFVRSMNGTALAPDSEEMQSLLAYMDWLSIDYPPGAKVQGQGIPRLRIDRAPDEKRGESLYLQKCSACHGVDGAGLSPGGVYAFPAVWGEKSFNIGAGMARLYTAAGFIRHNMPLGAAGSLSDDDAFDIAAYFAFRPRPDFARKDMDWPDGQRPLDARY